MSIHYGLPEGLLSSLCYVESRHNVNAINHDDGDANSVGVCQVKLKTAREMGFRGTEQQLMNPRMNVKYAAKYLRWQILRYKSVKKAVIAYNRGNARGLTTSKYQGKVYARWRKVNAKI